ncbi:hypothetical protein Tco_1511677, partial [Tanacetum coccineum]
MSTLTFADTYNMVAFLDKPAKSDGFHEIINFLNANQIRYALTVNPTIYTSCIQQFWATAKAQTFNSVRQIQALIDKKKLIITETSIRSYLHLEDVGCTDCLPTATIFEELARMGAKSTACNEFSRTMASLLICLATNQRFNLSKYIFDAMVKHLDGGVKFLIAEEKRRESSTKAQKRNLMSTYHKNMGGYKHNQLKSKSYEEIQKMFDNEIRRVNTFILMDYEEVKSKKGTKESSKGTEDELKSDKSKKAESSKEKAKGSRKKMLGKKRAGKEQQ